MQIMGFLRKLVKIESIFMMGNSIDIYFFNHTGGAQMKESTSTGIQRAAEKGRISGFRDFMFKELGKRRKNTSEDHITPESNSSRSENIPENNVSSSQNSKRKQTSKSSNIKCYDTISGNYLIRRSWDGNNMVEFFIRRKNF
jgi:hypothetical protein